MCQEFIDLHEQELITYDIDKLVETARLMALCKRLMHQGSIHDFEHGKYTIPDIIFPYRSYTGPLLRTFIHDSLADALDIDDELMEA